MKNASDTKVILVIFSIVFVVFALLLAGFGYMYNRFKDDSVIKKALTEINDSLNKPKPTPTPYGDLLPRVSPTPTPLSKPSTSNKNTSTSKTNSVISYNDNGRITTYDTNKNCIQYTIESGVFKSSKCYSSTDFADLTSKFFQYDSATSQLRFAESSLTTSCNKNSFSYFESICEYDKEQIAEAKDKINKLESEILELIKKGK